jgi:hypothetical protein
VGGALLRGLCPLPSHACPSYCSRVQGPDSSTTISPIHTPCLEPGPLNLGLGLCASVLKELVLNPKHIVLGEVLFLIGLASLAFCFFVQVLYPESPQLLLASAPALSHRTLGSKQEQQARTTRLGQDC